MRLVFASLGSLGDLHPLLALAGACKSRGHSVRIAASRGFEDAVRKAGFEFARIRPDLDPTPETVARLSHSRLGPERLLKDEVFPAVRDTYADLCEVASDADLIVVGELLYVTPLVSRTLGIPWVNAMLSPTSFLSATDPCVLAPIPRFHALRHLGSVPHRAIFAIGRWLTSQWGAPLNQLARELGMPSPGNAVFDGKHSPHRVLALFPEFFSPQQSDWPEATVQTGFPYWEASGEVPSKLQTFLESGERPVVFTLGSSMVYAAENFYNAAAETCTRLGIRGVLLVGGNAVPNADPARVCSIPYAPLDGLLPHADAMVHHGGIGGCARALRYGLPSLVIPFGYDQPDNAERLRRLGVAHLLARKVAGSTDHLATALENLLADSAIRNRAKSLAAKIHPAQDLGTSVDVLEAVVADTTLSANRA